MRAALTFRKKDGRDGRTHQRDAYRHTLIAKARYGRDKKVKSEECTQCRPGAHLPFSVDAASVIIEIK